MAVADHPPPRYASYPTAGGALGGLAALITSLVVSGLLDHREPSTPRGVEAADQISIFALSEGDCLILGDLADTDEVRELAGFESVPCEDEHDGEVVFGDPDYFVGRADFPGQDAAYQEAAEVCPPELDRYTQTSYDDSPYDVMPVLPTSKSWAQTDDRQLVCIGVTLNESWDGVIMTTGSIKAPLQEAEPVAARWSPSTPPWAASR